MDLLQRKLIKHEDTLLSYMKIPHSDMMDDYLFETYFQKELDALCVTYKLNKVKIKKSKKKLKKADMIRLKHNEKSISKNNNNNNLYEYMLLNYFRKMLELKKAKDDNWYGCYYILHNLFKLSIRHANRHVITFIKDVLQQESIQKKYPLNTLLKMLLIIWKKMEFFKKMQTVVCMNIKRSYLLYANAMDQK
jgi:hypothetical protein